MSDHDAILESAQKAGLSEVYVDDDGDAAMRLTPDGERIARQLSMTDEDGADALMAALLEED